MKTLNHRQITVARAVAGAFFDDGSGSLPQERLDFAMRELRRVVSRAGYQTRLAFRFACLAIQFAPFLLGRLRRFSRLELPARQTLLRKLEPGLLGLVVVLFKNTLSIVYFEHPDALAETGYDGRGMDGPAWASDGESPLAKLPVLPDRAPPARVSGARA